ncbi:Kinesin-like protein KIN-14F, partial [Sarracenia purpurea var. burkii]
MTRVISQIPLYFGGPIFVVCMHVCSLTVLLLSIPYPLLFVGGHAKTLMFIHINPEVNAIGETISTLKFAERVAFIELGAARSNKETGEIRELKEELALERKEAELEQLRSGNTHSTIESQRSRTVSPLHIPKYGIGASLKGDFSQHPVDDNRSSEVKGKQVKQDGFFHADLLFLASTNTDGVCYVE